MEQSCRVRTRRTFFFVLFFFFLQLHFFIRVSPASPREQSALGDDEGNGRRWNKEKKKEGLEWGPPPLCIFSLVFLFSFFWRAGNKAKETLRWESGGWKEAFFFSGGAYFCSFRRARVRESSFGCRSRVCWLKGEWEKGR